MKNLLFLILFSISACVYSQIKLVCEYNSEWYYDWYHDDFRLDITTNVLYSIGKNVSGNYKVIITNKCDTVCKTINIQKLNDTTAYYFNNINLVSCNPPHVFDDLWYNEIENDLAFIIFPNPAKNLLNFRVYRGTSEYYKITIYEHTGRKIIETRLNGDGQIDINILVKGSYIFEVHSEKNKKYEILIIY